MQFCNLLLFSSHKPGVKSWAEPLPRLVEQANVISVFVMRGRARKAWGLRIAIFIICNSIWSIQSIIPYLTSPQNINNHLLNSTFHIWTSHHFLIYDIQSTHFISSLQAAPADQHLTKPGNRHIRGCSQETDLYAWPVLLVNKSDYLCIDRLDIYDVVTWARSFFSIEY